MYKVKKLVVKINKEKYIFVMVAYNEFLLINIPSLNRWLDKPFKGDTATEQELRDYIGGHDPYNTIEFVGNRNVTLTKRVSLV